MKVYICIPTHGREVDGGLLTASHQLGEVNVTIAWTQFSLLAANFNRGLCAAKDGGFDWMLLWHGDLFPSGNGWLADMVSRGESARADLFGGVAMIKANQGLTSTACETPDGIRRISLRELAQLPEVFCAADVSRILWPATRLLLNTGMLLIRLAKVDPVALHFSVLDMVERRADGTHKWATFPEDWLFSRKAEKLGLRVYATKTPMVSHIGSVEFSTGGEPWGVQSDPARGVWEGGES